MKKYIAWPTGEQDVVRARIARHRELDEITQGYGYEVGWYRGRPDRVRACAVGCSLDRYDHAEYSRVLGVDLRVARLVDLIHESLLHEDAINWPGRVAAALTPGADTTLVADRFLIWVLRNGRCGRDENCARVAALYSDRLLGLEPSGDTWLQERGAADDADDADDDCAARAAACAASPADASSASSAAAYASADASDWAIFWRQAADVLIEVLSRCEVAA